MYTEVFAVASFTSKSADSLPKFTLWAVTYPRNVLWIRVLSLILISWIEGFKGIDNQQTG